MVIRRILTLSTEVMPSSKNFQHLLRWMSDCRAALANEYLPLNELRVLRQGIQ
jgi:hypothetical protein